MHCTDLCCVVHMVGTLCNEHCKEMCCVGGRVGTVYIEHSTKMCYVECSVIQCALNTDICVWFRV